jgi:RNA 2',3'-cyclic 3'-phosphodiesterase
MAHRLFIAIRPPEAVRDRLVDAMEAIEGARWVDEENLHLTLRFVGEVEREAANDLAAALGRISWPDFALRIEGVGHFKRAGRFGGHATALWARIPATAALEGLRQKVEAACEAAGLGRETRRFTAHVTLARLDRSSGPIGGWLSRFGDLRAGPWQASEFVLYESHLGHTGAFYEPVTVFGLRN